VMECGADNVARPTGALSTCEMRRSAVWAVNDQEECTIARVYVEIRILRRIDTVLCRFLEDEV